MTWESPKRVNTDGIRKQAKAIVQVVTECWVAALAQQIAQGVLATFQGFDMETVTVRCQSKYKSAQGIHAQHDHHENWRVTCS